MQNEAIQSVTILGGGTAGWMTAAALSKHLPKTCKITLIESEEISTVGVGEATIPAIRTFNQVLGLDEAEFMRETNASFKLGIQFENWGNIGDSYHHAFGYFGYPINNLSFHHYWLRLKQQQDLSTELHEYNLPFMASEEKKFAHRQFSETAADSRYFYAFQFDASLYAKYLRQWSERNGVIRVEGKVKHVNQHANSEFIKSLTLENGEEISGELFIDCSGFRGLLINQTLKTEFNDWSHWLPCNRAWAVSSSYPEGTTNIPPFTRARALKAGWQWRIPLQNRTGDGHVFCNKFVSEDEAHKILLDNIEGEAINDPHLLKFTTGCREKTWAKNCVAIGLSGGFLEPLESTSIYLIQSGILQLIKNFPDKSFNQTEITEFNNRMRYRYEESRNFLILHYNATNRTDSDFWDYCRTMEVPEELSARIASFKSTGNVITRESDLFVEHNWLAVLFGQGILPENYDKRADSVDEQQLNSLLVKIKDDVSSAVLDMPSHYKTIANYCAGNLFKND